MNGFIYLITNKANGKKYIGKTNDINKRWNFHLYANKKEYQTPLYRSMKKYGIENFELSVIETIDTEDKKELNLVLAPLEKKYISQFKTKTPNGYNLTDGGEGLSGMEFSENHKLMISKSLSGRKKSDEHRKKLSATRKLMKIPSPNLGKTLSNEIKEKISNSKKGQNSGENNPFYGKKHSKEFIEWIKQKNREYSNDPVNLEYNRMSQPNRIAVNMFDKDSGELLNQFDSLKQAKKWIFENTKYKGDVSTIKNAVDGKKKLAYGFVWKAAE